MADVMIVRLRQGDVQQPGIRRDPRNRARQTLAADAGSRANLALQKDHRELRPRYYGFGRIKVKRGQVDPKHEGNKSGGLQVGRGKAMKSTKVTKKRQTGMGSGQHIDTFCILLCPLCPSWFKSSTIRKAAGCAAGGGDQRSRCTAISRDGNSNAAAYRTTQGSE